MEDHLIRLLETESRAQAIIDAASAGRQRILDEALATVRDDEARFEAGRAGPIDRVELTLALCLHAAFG